MYELTLGIIKTQLEAIDSKAVNIDVDLITKATELYILSCDILTLKNRVHRIDNRRKLLRGKL